MTEAFPDTLHSWQNFYFMVGGASAGLMGLMFVALSLGMHLVNDKTRAEFPAFVTPSILYFVSALLLSGVMLVPSFTPTGLGVMLLAAGVIGIGRTTQHVSHLVRVALKHRDFTLWDWLSQIIFPMMSYGLILLAALALALSQESLAFSGLWLATLLLLVCAIANTWSLVLWIIEQRPT
jgi:hypothetical protein